jgi:hypothetical protein
MVRMNALHEKIISAVLWFAGFSIKLLLWSYAALVACVYIGLSLLVTALFSLHRPHHAQNAL